MSYIYEQIVLIGTFGDLRNYINESLHCLNSECFPFNHIYILINIMYFYKHLKNGIYMCICFRLSNYVGLCIHYMSKTRFEYRLSPEQ